MKRMIVIVAVVVIVVVTVVFTTETIRLLTLAAFTKSRNLV